MKKDNAQSKKLTDLRKRAEEILRSKTDDLQMISDNDVQSLIHELQVHQIELEMQNEELRRAQIELEESHNRYSDLYDFAPIGYFTFDKNGLILEVNLTGANKLGIERSFLIKKPFNLYIAPEDKDIFYLHLQQVFKTKTQQTCEIKLMSKDRIQFDAHLESLLVQDGEGKSSQCRTAINDITERKLAEKKIEHLASFPRLNPDPIIEVDANGTVTYYNAATKEVLKALEIEEDARIFLPRDFEEIIKALEQEKETQLFYREVQVKDRIFAESISVSKKLMTMRIYMHEITERRQAEEINKFQANILSQVNDAVIAFDNDNRIIYLNNGAEQLYNLRNNEMLGMTLEESYRYLGPDPEVEKDAHNSLAERGTWRKENISVKRGGEEKYVDVSVSVLKDESGAKIGTLAVVRDVTERMKIEEVLRESEEKNRNLFDSAGDAIITIDLEDRVTSWNRSAERIFGWKATEAIGKKLDELIVPKDVRAERKRIIRDSLAGKNITGIEAVRLRKDGSRVDVSLTSSPIINVDKRIVGLSGILRDITESKHAEKERLRLIDEIKKRHGQTENLAMNLKKERDTLQIIMENTATQLAYLDSDFNFIRVNSAFADGSGHKKGELVGKNHFELFPNPENQAIFERVRDAGKAVEFKAMPFEFPDQPWRGTTYWDWTLTPVKDAGGRVDRLVLSRMDTTERVLREQAIQKALTYAESIVDTIPEPLLILDSNQRVKTANHAFYKMFRVSIEETKNRSLYDLGNRQWDIPKLHELLDEVIPKNSHVKDFEVEHEFPNIGRKTMLLNASKFQQDGTDMILLSIEDITQFKKAEDIRLENERLISANQARSEFLSIMSHELRTPLTSVIGYSILLREQELGKLNKKQEFYVDSVLANSKHLLSLINSLLDLAKMEAGKLELVVENVSVPEIIGESLNLIKEKARIQHIILKKDLDTAINIIEADRQKFKQILFNLLSNALKFSKEGGGIIKVSAKKEGGMAKISVSDTGIGIREEDIPRLFLKFEQLDSGITRKYGGTGLGLAITKQLVELHGGKITAESRYGEGSTFTFLLPIER